MAERKRAVRILAKSIYRELTSQGYSEQQIVSLATELIAEVTDNIGAIGPVGADAPAVHD